MPPVQSVSQPACPKRCCRCCHTHHPPTHPPTAGLLTLVFIVLAATNFRLILENMLKYGLRFNPFTFVRAALTPSGNLPLLLCWPWLATCSLLGYGVESLALALLRAEQQAASANHKRGVGFGEARRRQQRQMLLSENFILLLNVANINAALVGPAVVIALTHAEPLPGFALTMAAAILWLKLVSYAHVNWDLRWVSRGGGSWDRGRGGTAAAGGGWKGLGERAGGAWVALRGGVVEAEWAGGADVRAPRVSCRCPCRRRGLARGRPGPARPGRTWRGHLPLHLRCATLPLCE